MLSTRWYARVPKDENQNRQFRLDILREARGSRQARDWLRACCADDTLFYFNAFLWAYDPRLVGDKAVPLITFPIQDQLIERLETSIQWGRDLQIEKSRDLGASVICTAVLEKRWHFNRDESFMLFSRNEKEVDWPGRPGCLFWKIDWIHTKMPQWLMPKGYSRDKHRRKMVFENPQQNCTINGEVMVPEGGVGDRKTAILIDEFSRIEYADELDLGTADATNCRIFNFTAYGENNAADRMRRNPAVRKIVMHWTADPRKNQKLYCWNGDRQRFEYFRYANGEGEEIEFGDRKLRLVRCGPHEWDRGDDFFVGEEKVRFEPVRDGRLRSPVYDREFARRRNPRWMAINWDIDYVSSESKFFDTKLLLELNVETVRNPSWQGDIEIDEGTCEIREWVERRDGPIKLWLRPGVNFEMPRSKLGYAGGSDIARGSGATNSCLSIGDASSGHKVLEYVTPHLTVERFARRCVALGRAFQTEDDRPALLAWEKQGPGEDFRRALLELGYDEVWTENQNVGRIPTSKTVLPGWNPTARRRADLFGEYQVSLRERRFINRSDVALVECNDFLDTPLGCVYKTAKATKSTVMGDESGAGANHGDRVTADALCNRVMIALGRPRAEKPVVEEDHEVFGSLAWRIAHHKRAKRDRERIWS